MVSLPIYQVDAFAERPFQGNPAAVVVLDRWLPDSLMQQIAAENNLSETAFYVATTEGFAIRWFTPVSEVDLCGHATLATAHVLHEHLGHDPDRPLVFSSRSGPLIVSREQDLLVLDFPADPPIPCPMPALLPSALGRPPLACLNAMDYLAIFASEAEIRDLQPDWQQLKTLQRRGVIASAPGTDHDFVCRFFAPNYGINEDPVTGSAFTQLAPYWAERLGRNKFTARQLSSRGGEVRCRLSGDRVMIAGRAVTYLTGTITVDAFP